MPTILVIDDDVDFRAMLSVALRQMGHEVVEAVEGMQGVRLFQTRDFDVVLTDLIMPGQEGIETISTLVKLCPPVKIIAMSGGGRTSPESNLKMSKRLGAKAVLAKPFSMDELRGMIETVLAAK